MTNPPGRSAQSRPELRAIEAVEDKDRAPRPEAARDTVQEAGEAARPDARPEARHEAPAPETQADSGSEVVSDETLAARRAIRRARRLARAEAEARAGTAGAAPAGSESGSEAAPEASPEIRPDSEVVSDETLAARRARRARRLARAEAEARRAEVDPSADPGADPGAAPETPAEAVPAAKAAPGIPSGTPAEVPAPEPAPAERARGLRARRAARRAPQRAKVELSPEEIAEVAGRQPEVRPARAERRHIVIAASFLALVILPFLVVTAYLYTRAADQYHSAVAFSVRSEDAGGGASGILGALTSMGSGSASDTDILFEFIRSQKIVEEIDPELDLRAIYNKAPGDFWFRLGEDHSIEALTAQWNRMVDVNLGSAGIIEVKAKAFEPEDAKKIAEAILVHSSALVNRLSEQARADAIQFAQGEQKLAEAHLKEMRQKMSDFRREHRLVDPTADVAGQAGLLNALQGQLAQQLVDRDMLKTYASDTDQRMIQANRRIEAITARIDQERGSLGVEGVEGSLPEVLSAYEELRVDLEFANAAYTQTLAALAAAKAEAGRQSRYLAPHIQPTFAETSLYPRRATLAGLSFLFLTLGWGVVMLLYYNVRDNR